MSQDLWAQFMNLQGPAMQSLMQAYIEQSQKMFAQFQEQMQSQARNMFSGLSFPGFPTGQQQERRGQVLRLGFVSLGCPKALVDSERILTQLRAGGLRHVGDLRRRRPRHREHLRIHRRGGARIPRRHRRGARRERQVVVTGLPRRKGGRGEKAHPSVLAVTGPTTRLR
jgi:hypothetical protein